MEHVADETVTVPRQLASRCRLTAQRSQHTAYRSPPCCRCCACYEGKHFVDEAPFAVSAGASKAALGSRPRRGSKQLRQQGQAQISLVADASSGSPQSPTGGYAELWNGCRMAVEWLWCMSLSLVWRHAHCR